MQGVPVSQIEAFCEVRYKSYLLLAAEVGEIKDGGLSLINHKICNDFSCLCLQGNITMIASHDHNWKSWSLSVCRGAQPPADPDRVDDHDV